MIAFLNHQGTKTPRFFLVFMFVSFLSVQVMAKEEKAKSEDTAKAVTYAPDFCEFEITFPEEPYISRRCDRSGKKDCRDLTSFTQVFDMASTVNFRVICSPVDEKIYEDYSAEVMEATLRAMTKQTVIKAHKSAFRDGDGYKQAGLVGEGMVGRTPMIYIAQLWIGKRSALTVEAELIGGTHPEADKLFSEILMSIRPVAEREAEENSE